MTSDSWSGTNPTLLSRIRLTPHDQEAWRDFDQRYRPKILEWCRSWNLQPQDAQDVTQDVLAKLVKNLATFEYDPRRSFRGWLRTIARHAFSDFLKGRRRFGTSGSDESMFGQLQTNQACDTFVDQLQEEFEREQLREAMARVQLRVEPKTWQVFVMNALDGKPAKEVAQAMAIKVPAVYMAKKRVQDMLCKEMARLGGATSE